MFALIFLGLLGLIYGYTGWRLVSYLAAPWDLVASAILVLLILLPLGLFRLRSHPTLEWLSDPLSWIAYLGMGFFIVCTSLLLVRDALGLGLVLFYSVDPVVEAKIDAATFALALALAAWGFYQARRTPAVTEVCIPIAGLPPALCELRIVQLSDLHVGPTIKGDFVRRVVERVNQLQPDLIVFTGDLADGTIERLAPHVAPLADLRAPLGLFFATGNHEYYSGVEAWTGEARRLGFEVLLNEGRILDFKGARIALAGVTDLAGDEEFPDCVSDPAKALATADGADLRILMAHQPRSIEAAAEAGCHLQLSGHTHGGQFIPWKYVVSLQQPFVAGLHKFRHTWIYVHRGTGYWGPPLRLGARAEIAVLAFCNAP
jgi:predicted MPP superfamily phosphohydrolase